MEKKEGEKQSGQKGRARGLASRVYAVCAPR
jgi:hypothetical protein